jgi:hypothetical protein
VSELTYRLSYERPSRKLCEDAATRIAELEEVLLMIEAHAYGIRPLKASMLETVQSVLYEKATANALMQKKGD